MTINIFLTIISICPIVNYYCVLFVESYIKKEKTIKMINLKKIIILVLLICIIYSISIYAQQPDLMNSAETQIALKKLLTFGSVLYVGAHPDDENTANLAYFSKEKMMRAGYLALTRGDGGQNLIGSEKGELMGLIRTYELLEARKIDSADKYLSS